MRTDTPRIGASREAGADTGLRLATSDAAAENGVAVALRPETASSTFSATGDVADKVVT